WETEEGAAGIRGCFASAFRARIRPVAEGGADMPIPKEGPLSPDLLRRMDAWWRAANYLSVGQIYLFNNPLLKKPLELSDVKPRLLGHWGTTPGLNFLWVHLNRV